MNKDRLFALFYKELLQIRRDFSSILIAFILPVILLFLFGFGINFDTNTVKIGVLAEDKTIETAEFIDTMRHSRFLNVNVYNSRAEIEKDLKMGTIRGFVVIPNNFTKNLKNRAGSGKSGNLNERSLNGAEIQIITDGSEPNTAKFVSAYVLGTVNIYKLLKARDFGVKTLKTPGITVVDRFWYNPALKSTYFILPGSLAIIMTMIGTVLTALVIAREWERGTMEAILTTKATKIEFLAAKYAAYFLLSMASIGFSLFLIIFIFKVPFYGSFFWFWLTSALFMLGALGFGFFISTISKDQFIASQISGVVGFMPAMMLSGLIYEINSMPLFLRILTVFIPARYYVASISSLFLSGTVVKTLVLNAVFLGVFAVLTFILVYSVTPERLENQ